MNTITDNQQHLKNWLTLNFAPNLTIKQYHYLLKTYHAPTNITALSIKQLTRHGLSDKTIHALHNPNNLLIEKSLHWLSASSKHHLLTWDHLAFPKSLLQLSSPPKQLFAHGNLDLLNRPQIAIVGARKCSPYGRQIAHDIALELSNHHWVITSGLALGIDGASHQGVLQGSGHTIAVLGSGLDWIYPKSHHHLAHAIIQQHGLLLSEYPPGTKPAAYHFPQRNRLISGLCVGILIVEAKCNSGSLITAQYALDQGKEIFAIPGSPLSNLSTGCLSLIQNGAILVKNGQEIHQYLCDNLPYLRINYPSMVKYHSNKAEQKQPQHILLQALSHGPRSIDELIDVCGLTLEQVSSMLVLLQITGNVEQIAGTYYICQKKRPI